MNKVLAAAATAAMIAVSGTAAAQSTPTNNVLAPTSTPTEEVPRFGRSMEHAAGLRTWFFTVPSWMVGLFANVNPEWSGATNIAIGPEYTYRRGSLDVVVGLQYTGLQAADGYFHGSSEGDQATERVKSSLWAFYANALFLWHVRAGDWFEFQYGAGVGLGYVGGDLYRNQVYRTTPGGSFADCRGPLMPGTVTSSGEAYCDRANNHYGSYTEPYLTSSGNIPPVIPWISLPHLALHFRPHRHFDIRLDGGFALVGFYGGAALHYVF